MSSLPSDPFADYLDAIEAIPPLTADEETALWEAVGRGDEAAKKRLIEASLRLVVPIAYRYAGRGLALADLLQEGNIGLVRAVERSDLAPEHQFSSVAQRAIDDAIAHAVGWTERPVLSGGTR